MKRYSIIAAIYAALCVLAACVLVPVVSYAGIRAVSLYISPASTNGTASTYSVPNVTGELLAMEIDVTTTASVAVATTAGTGSSISGAKTLKSAANVVGGSTTVYTNSVGALKGTLLYNDIVTLTASGVVGTAEAVNVLLILDTK